MSRWVEVKRPRDEQEIPGEGVEYITAADEERRRVNRERQRRFRERVKAGAKIAVYKPRQPGATKVYTRKTRIDRGCNCTLQEVKPEHTDEQRVLRAMGIRYMLDTETGETYTMPDPMSEQWRTTRSEYEEQLWRRSPAGAAAGLREAAWRLRTAAAEKRVDADNEDVESALEQVEEALREWREVDTRYAGRHDTDDYAYNPMFGDTPDRIDEIFTSPE